MNFTIDWPAIACQFSPKARETNTRESRGVPNKFDITNRFLNDPGIQV